MQVLDRTGVGTLWSICKTKFALVGHTHNVIQDAGDGSNITFAYSKPGLNYNDFTWLAGWNGRELRAVNKSLFAAASHTHTLGQITNAGAAASKNVRTLNSVSHSSWSSASTDDLYVPTMSFIAYWNGAYNSSGNSNLQYCYKGKFGNLAVKDTADWSQITNKPDLKNWSETKSYIDSRLASSGGGIMIHSFNFTPQNKTLKLDESRDGIVLIRLSKSEFNYGDDENCVLDASEFMARKAGNSLIFIQTISYKYGVNIKTNDGGIQYTQTYGDNYSNGAGSSMSISLMSIHFGIVISEGGSNGSIAYYIGR